MKRLLNNKEARRGRRKINQYAIVKQSPQPHPSTAKTEKSQPFKIRIKNLKTSNNAIRADLLDERTYGRIGAEGTKSEKKNREETNKLNPTKKGEI
jgi:hypothetical protein